MIWLFELICGCDLGMDVNDYEKMGMNMTCSVSPQTGKAAAYVSRKEATC